MDYEHIDEKSVSIGLEMGAAEAHGTLCGLLCGGIADPEPQWLAQLFEDHDPQDLLVQECQRELQTLADQTRENLQDPLMALELLLPDDNRRLRQRARALRDWCQGFLYGLGLSGIGDGELSGPAAEAVRDTVEIARLDPAIAAADEEDEGAFMELCEFVRVAAMLLYEEQAAKPGNEP